MHKLPVLWIVLLFTAACASEAAPVGSTTNAEALAVAQNPQPAELPTNAAGEPLVAQVNGQGITRAAFESALIRAQQQFLAADSAALQATVLDTMIEQVLIEQAAAGDDVIITDAAVEAEFQANKALAGSDAAWQKWLTENQYTETEFRDTVRAMLIVGTMRDRVTQNMPEAVLHVHARHILVETEQAANDVLARLQNGEDFAALAASLSRDVTTRDQGGDLGWFVEGELLESVLMQVASSLDDGQIGGPVATRLGYHIIQKLGSEERALTPEKRALLAQFRFEDWLRGLTFNAIIERYLP